MNPTGTNEYIFYNTITKTNDITLNEEIKKILEKNKKPITFGKCSRFYLYMLGTCFFKILSLLILGANKDKENEFGLFGFCPVLNQYNFIQSIYTYIGYIIFGLIFYYFKDPDKSDSKEKKEFYKNINISGNKNIDTLTKNINLKIFFLCIIFIFHIEIKKVLYIQGFMFFNIWTSEIILMHFLMLKYLSIDNYKHHKISLLCNATFCSGILVFILFLPTSLYDGDRVNSFQFVQKKLGNYFYGILLFFVFLILSVAFCFTRIYSKVLMQIKFISPYKLVFLFGITGLIISLIASVVGYYINYSDNLFNYFSSMKSVLDKGETYHFYGEIFLVSLINSFSNSMEFNFEMLIIYYLNPLYILLSNSLYFTISQLINFMLNISSDGLVIAVFIITELIELFTGFGLMVYLEIIELNCCGLNYDLKKTIMKKAEIEFRLLNNTRIDDDGEDEENNN